MPNSTTPASQAAHEQVQQVLLNSTTPTSQEVHQQRQKELQHPTTPASQVVQEQMSHDPHNSSNLESNNQYEEQGLSTNKRKRGGSQMQSVHGRSERKLIVLNDLNQPIGPPESIVKELGSFLSTLARNRTFCPVNILDWRKLKTHDNMWNYIKEKYVILEAGKDYAI